MDYKSRLKYFQKTLSTNEDDMIFDDPVIDMAQFRLQCFYGIPDPPGIRQKAWKLLLGYLPPDKRLWPKVLVEQRALYYQFVRELLAEPDPEVVGRGADHPLNAAPDSKWAIYFADTAMLEQIDKDVRRTLPDFAFFQLAVPITPLSPLSPHFPSFSLTSANPLSATLDTITSVITGRPRSASQVSNRSLRGGSRRSSWSSVKSHASEAEGKSTVSSSRGLAKMFSKLGATPPSQSPLVGPPRTTPLVGGMNATSVVNETVDITPIPTRRSLFKRIAHLNQDFGAREHQPVGNPVGSRKIMKTSLGMLGRGVEEGESEEDQVDLHWEAIERLLFIYAKLNPGVGYVQGMNELLGPIYYLFANDTSEMENQAHAEADAFFVFTLLMASVRDHFVRTLDTDSQAGIGATLAKLGERLRWVDEPLWYNLVEEKEIKEQYYAFRWITVLGTQEWQMPEAIRLWDSVLGDPERGDSVGSFEFLIDFFVAMVVCVREELLKGDFAENMKLLQNYPISDISLILSKAYKIRDFRLANNVPNPETASISSNSSRGSAGFSAFEFPRASWDTLRKDSINQIFGGLRNSTVGSRLSRFGRYRSNPPSQGVAGDLFGEGTNTTNTTTTTTTTTASVSATAFKDGGPISRGSSNSSSIASSGSTTDWLFKRKLAKGGLESGGGGGLGAFLRRPTPLMVSEHGTSGVADRVNGWMKNGGFTESENEDGLIQAQSAYSGII